MILLILKMFFVVAFGTWITPRTWVPGELVTASMMNVQIRDNMNSLRSEHFGVQGFRGLVLRTHPDADVAASKVQFTADQIVMDDATRLAFTTPITVDIAASGAGGLDTGSEGASRWYEIYAIAKDDGTKNGLFHRAKDYALDEQQTTQNDVTALRRASAPSQTKISQGFTPDFSDEIHFVDISIETDGTPPAGQIWLTIEANNAGAPSGTPLATSDKISSALVAATQQWVRFAFRVPMTTVGATLYHLVLQGNYTASDTNRIYWGRNNAGGYAGGSAQVQNAGTWVAETGDMCFKVYVDQNDAAVTMPSGYTKKALIGWVRNDGSSNFVAFIAKDRKVTKLADQDLGTLTATIPTLYDLSAYLPPAPCRATFAARNNTAAQYCLIVGAPDGYGATVGVGVGGGQRLTSSTADVPIWGEVITEFQSAYLFVSGNTGNFWSVGYEW